ncbi:MAG: hypothetical protein J6C01_10690 [Lachnospiraceae bacterium]|nr:hypothetical protein [Lachnospiraceae bacterium]
MDYVMVSKDEDCIDICFYIEQEKPFRIGEKMNEIHEDAYMNGYNWEMFLNYYLENNAPEVLEGLDTDPEAGLYAAYYDVSDENEKKAEKLAEIIRFLIENEDELYRIIREEGNQIDWE